MARADRKTPAPRRSQRTDHEFPASVARGPCHGIPCRPPAAHPFASSWKPGAVALGVVAAWSLVAVELTSLAMRRLPRRIWRGIHLVSYLTFWLTSLHAALAGTDRTQGLYQATAAVSIALVAWAVIYRLTHLTSRRPGPSGGRTPTGRPAPTSTS